MYHVWGRGELCTEFWGKDTGVDWRIILRWIFRKWDVDMDWIDLA